jgi:hypothetical protein
MRIIPIAENIPINTSLSNNNKITFSNTHTFYDLAPFVSTFCKTTTIDILDINTNGVAIFNRDVAPHLPHTVLVRNVSQLV